MYKTIDLFAGAGGLSYGFEMTNKFEVVAVAENNKNARETFAANHKNKTDLVVIEDVRDCNFGELSDKLKGIDIVIGGPPCQGFSNANRQKNHIISMNNSLVKEYFRAIKEIRPKAFIMENVAMLASPTHRFYDSHKDHEEVNQMNIKMREEHLVILDVAFKGYNLNEIFQSQREDHYKISDVLFQYLSVLFKNRNHAERLDKFVKKNKSKISCEIESHNKEGKERFHELEEIYNSLKEEEFLLEIDRLEAFIKFQKAFRLKQELDDNKIIYELKQDETTGRVVSVVSSYSVIDYVDKVLSDEYIKKGQVVNSLWFGVPQERKRFILMGIKKSIVQEEIIELPQSNDKDVVTVGEAILDLATYSTSEEVVEGISEQYHEDENLSEYARLMRQASSGISNHIVTKSREKAKERFRALKEGENFHKLSSEMKDNYADPSRTQNSIYLRLDSSKPSGTVINVRKSMWIHPTLDRAISIREAARLQSFPDRFIFKGPKDAQYQQIGNAVPPLMAKGIAENLIKYIEK